MSRANDLTAAVKNLIAAYGGYAWRNANQPRISKDGKAFFANKDSIGSPDVIALMPNGVTLWIEVKVGKDKLRPSQEAFRQECEKRGHNYIVVQDDVDELSLILYDLQSAQKPPASQR